MDPDDPHYLPAVLSASSLIRAHDLFVRSRTTSFPRSMRARSRSPAARRRCPTTTRIGARSAGDRAEEVDLVIASVASQLDDRRRARRASGGGRALHEDGGRRAQPDRHRLGHHGRSKARSIRSSTTPTTCAAITSSSPRRPASKAAVAGLLARRTTSSRRRSRRSPASTSPPGSYTDAQLEQLITGNVTGDQSEAQGSASSSSRACSPAGGRSTCSAPPTRPCATSRRSPTSTSGCSTTKARATHCASRSSRCSCRCSATARIVPSTDGKDPAFTVDVYSTQADFANGIVRDRHRHPSGARHRLHLRDDPGEELIGRRERELGANHASNLHGVCIRSEGQRGDGRRICSRSNTT